MIFTVVFTVVAVVFEFTFSVDRSEDAAGDHGDAARQQQTGQHEAEGTTGGGAHDGHGTSDASGGQPWRRFIQPWMAAL